MATIPPLCDFDWRAPDFELIGTDGKTYLYKDIAGPKGTLIAFLSNHCPYVKAIEQRLARDAGQLQKLGIGFAAICSNDPVSYPDDDIEGMRRQVSRANFTFPYLHDRTQEVARAYAAVCTPDFFGFDAGGGLQYRGRLDASRKETGASDLRRDLYEAMKQVAETGHGPSEQFASMGCSIKWAARV